MENSKLIDKIRYLYGASTGCSENPCYDSARRKTLPVQSSPLREYVNDVNRFLFSGGISITAEGLPSNHSAHEYLKKHNEYLSKFLFNIWETLATTGDLLIVLNKTLEDRVGFEFFEYDEFKPVYQHGELISASIRTTVMVDGKEFVYRRVIDGETYKEYPLVLTSRERYHDWEKSYDEVPHGFEEIPAIHIKVNPSFNSNRGYPEFNISSVNQAASIVRIEYGLDENIEFFGNPLIDSPDPDATIEALNNKIQVLQKQPNEDGGGHTLLQPNPLSSEEIEYLKYKKEAFNKSLGISNPFETDSKDSSASGRALIIRNDAIISRAQTKWQEIVDDGLAILFEKLLRISGKLNHIFLGSFDQKVKISRNLSYFTPTQEEQLKELDIAERLVDLGVKPDVSLQLTFFKSKTLEEINQLLRPNREDVL